MTIPQIKREAIAHLRHQGRVISESATMHEIVYAIQGKNLSSGITAFVIDWVRAQPPLPEVVIVAPPYRPGRRPTLSFTAQFKRNADRAAQCQPPMMTPQAWG